MGLDAAQGSWLRDAVSSFGLLTLPLGVAAWLLAPLWAALRTRSLDLDAARVWTERAAPPDPTERSPYRKPDADPGAALSPSNAVRAIGLLGVFAGHVGAVWLPVGAACLPFSWWVFVLSALGVGFFALLAACSESLLRGGRLALDETILSAGGLLGYAALAIPMASAIANGSGLASATSLSRAMLGTSLGAIALGTTASVALVVGCSLPRTVLPESSRPASSAWKQRLLALGLVMVGCSVAYRSLFIERSPSPDEPRPRLVMHRG